MILLLLLLCYCWFFTDPFRQFLLNHPCLFHLYSHTSAHHHHRHHHYFHHPPLLHSMLKHSGVTSYGALGHAPPSTLQVQGHAYKFLSTGWLKNGATISLQKFWKFHDRIAWKLVNFCNIIWWTQSLTFCLKIYRAVAPPSENTATVVYSHCTNRFEHHTVALNKKLMTVFII